jgi:hypothetical protein
MAKQQTFADKLKKQSKNVQCPECGEARQPTLVLRPVDSPKGSVRIREVRVTVCKCNRKEVYG